MKRSVVLLIDAIINLILGVLLFAFPGPVVEALGIPESDSRFYPSILGAVLTGIGIALLIECRTTDRSFVGLGLGGAVVINVLGGLCLAGWLLSGDFELPVRGQVFLWSLVVLLVGISAIEVGVHLRTGRNRR